MIAILRECVENLRVSMPFEAEKGGLGYSTQAHLPSSPKFIKIKLGEWFFWPLEDMRIFNFQRV